MNTKTMMLLGGLLSLPLLTTSVQAASVKVSQGIDLSAPVGDTLIVDVIGEGFADGGPDGAAFSLTWDPTILTFISVAILDELIWDTALIDESNGGTGSIDYAFLIKSTPGGAGADFGLASFKFSVIGIGGATTNLDLGIDLFDSGFVLPGAIPIDVTYVDSQFTVVDSQVAAVPLPSTSWCILAGLLGAMRWQRQVARPR